MINIRQLLAVLAPKAMRREPAPEIVPLGDEASVAQFPVRTKDAGEFAPKENNNEK